MGADFASSHASWGDRRDRAIQGLTIAERLTFFRSEILWLFIIVPLVLVLVMRVLNRPSRIVLAALLSVERLADRLRAGSFARRDGRLRLLRDASNRPHLGHPRSRRKQGVSARTRVLHTDRRLRADRRDLSLGRAIERHAEQHRRDRGKYGGPAGQRTLRQSLFWRDWRGGR